MTERLNISSNTLPAAKPSTPPSPAAYPSPQYSLTLSFVRSTSGGKSLLGKGRASRARPYTSFFDAAGVMDQAAFELWVGEVVWEVMEGRGADGRVKSD